MESYFGECCAVGASGGLDCFLTTQPVRIIGWNSSEGGKF